MDRNEEHVNSYSSYDRYKIMKDTYDEKRENSKNPSFRPSNDSYRKKSFFEPGKSRFNRDDSRHNSKPYNNHYNRDNNQRDSHYNKSYSTQSNNTFSQSETTKLHPSWQAKKQMEAKSNVKFEGKKLKFDD